MIAFSAHRPQPLRKTKLALILSQNGIKIRSYPYMFQIPKCPYPTIHSFWGDKNDDLFITILTASTLHVLSPSLSLSLCLPLSLSLSLSLSLPLSLVFNTNLWSLRLDKLPWHSWHGSRLVLRKAPRCSFELRDSHGLVKKKVFQVHVLESRKCPTVYLTTLGDRYVA